MQETRKISLSTIGRIIRGDYGAFLSSVFPIVGWALYLYTQDSMFASIAIVITVVCIPIAALRIYSVTRILKSGVETIAEVTMNRYAPRRDRGYIKYSYTFQGQSYESGTAIMKTKATATLQPGDEIVVLVDADNPKRALPKVQYLET